MTVDPSEIDQEKVQKQMQRLTEAVEKSLDKLEWSLAKAPEGPDVRPGAEFYRGLNKDEATKDSFVGVTVVSWLFPTKVRGYDGAAMSREPPIMLHLTADLAKKAYETALRSLKK